VKPTDGMRHHGKPLKSARPFQALLRLPSSSSSLSGVLSVPVSNLVVSVAAPCSTTVSRAKVLGTPVPRWAMPLDRSMSDVGSCVFVGVDHLAQEVSVTLVRPNSSRGVYVYVIGLSQWQMEGRRMLRVGVRVDVFRRLIHTAATLVDKVSQTRDPRRN
jgi:hypothetical protein